MKAEGIVVTLEMLRAGDRVYCDFDSSRESDREMLARVYRAMRALAPASEPPGGVTALLHTVNEMRLAHPSDVREWDAGALWAITTMRKLATPTTTPHHEEPPR